MAPKHTAPYRPSRWRTPRSRCLGLALAIARSCLAAEPTLGAPPGLIAPAAEVVQRRLPDVVARIGDEPITRDRLWPRLQPRIAQALAAGEAVNDGLLRYIARPVVNAIIDEVLLGPKAAAAGFAPDLPRAQGHLETWLREPGSAIALDARLRNEGMSREQYVADVAVRTAITDWVRQTFVAGQTATADEVQALYTKRQASLVRAESVHLERLVVAAGPGDEARQQAREEAVRLRALVAAGVPLAATTPPIGAAAPRVRGAAVGVWDARRVNLPDLPPEVQSAVGHLEAGEISTVLELPEAFAIVRWQDRLPRRQLALAEVEAGLRENVKEDKGRDQFRIYLEELRKAAGVVIYPPLEDRPIALPGRPLAPAILRP